MDSAARLHAELRRRGATVATAESLTGGRLAGALTDVPGASDTFVGGVVSYASSLKVSVLAVPPSVVEAHGVVSPECASAMASGVRLLTGATYGLSTTGVAGPDTQEGKPAGTVYVGVSGPEGTRAIALTLRGERSEIRDQTTEAALFALSEQLSVDRPGTLGEETPLG